MLNVVLIPEKEFVAQSVMAEVMPKKKYQVRVEVTGIVGDLFCGYFGIVIFDKNNNETTRRIQWLNDFSGINRIINIVFQVPDNATHVAAIYRINNETPRKSYCRYMVQPLDNINILEVDSSMKENYDMPENYTIPRSRELNIQEELSIEENLVWIFASPRSGTTWLTSELLSHDTYFINEPLIGLHLGFVRTEIKDKIVRNFDLFKNNPDYFFSYRFKDSWTFYLKKLILQRFHNQFPNCMKKIIIKEPSGSMAADILSETLPNSKIIILLRDGRDIIDSKIDALRENGWATSSYGATPLRGDEIISFIRTTSREWNELTSVLMRVYENHNKDNCMMIRYEDLRYDTFTVVKKIYSFLKISISDDNLAEIVHKYKFENIPKDEKGTGKFKRAASPNKWKESFNENEKSIMNEIMGQTLQKLGYEV